MPKPDFRDPAVAASAKLLAEHADGDPLDAGVSYCIDAPDRPAKKSKWPTVVAMVAGIGMIGFAGVLAWIARGSESSADENRFLTLAVTSILSGFAVLIGYAMAQRRKMLNLVRRRIGEIPKDAITVNIKNGNPSDKSLLKGEESAVLLLHPDHRCVQIEGLRYRYLIHAADAQGVRLMGGGEHSTATTYLYYRIGEANLVLGMTSDRVMKMVLSSFTGSSGELFDRIKGCLRV